VLGQTIDQIAGTDKWVGMERYLQPSPSCIAYFQRKQLTTQTLAYQIRRTQFDRYRSAASYTTPRSEYKASNCHAKLAQNGYNFVASDQCIGAITVCDAIVARFGTASQPVMRPVMREQVGKALNFRGIGQAEGLSARPPHVASGRVGSRRGSGFE
jgi:hypothetical protein